MHPFVSPVSALSICLKSVWSFPVPISIRTLYVPASVFSTVISHSYLVSHPSIRFYFDSTIVFLLVCFTLGSAVKTRSFWIQQIGCWHQLQVVLVTAQIRCHSECSKVEIKKIADIKKFLILSKMFFSTKPFDIKKNVFKNYQTVFDIKKW